jgi:hypothetical protein
MIIGCDGVCLRGYNSVASHLWGRNVDPCNTISLGSSRHVIAVCVLRLPLSISHNVEPTQFKCEYKPLTYISLLFETHGTLCDICVV